MKIPTSTKLPGLKQRPTFFRDWLFSLWHWPSPETTEWFCLRTALWWVIQLAPCLHVFGVNSAFSGLAHYGPEGRWQLAMALLLLLQVAGVCCGHVWLRVGSLVCFSALWAFFAGMFWADAPHLHGLPRNTGVGIYASLAADCMIVAVHLTKIWYIDHLSRRKKEEEARCPSPSCSAS